MAEKRPPAARNQDGPSSQCSRVTYARMENVVKSAEFVLDIPGFDKYLRNAYDKQTTEDCINVSSDFNSDGIMANIQIVNAWSAGTYWVKYNASLRMDQACFNLYDISMEAFVFQDKKQAPVDSLKETKNGNQKLGLSGELYISASDILRKVHNGLTDTTFRIVLNIKTTIYKQPQPHPHKIGMDDQCDPPFLKAIQSGDDSDVELVCEGQIFPVHALILKNVSRVFRRMLEAPMKEAAMRKIVIEDKSADTTRKMVDYIYQGRIAVGSDSQAVNLLYAAEKYEFDSLKTACLKHMVASMSNQNITTFLQVSVQVNAGDDDIIKPMVAYCLSRIVDLLKREDFQAFAQANPSLFLGNSTSK